MSWNGSRAREKRNRRKKCAAIGDQCRKTCALEYKVIGSRMKDKTIYGIGHATDRNSISWTWIEQGKHAASKKSTLTDDLTVVPNHIGLSIRPFYLGDRAPTVSDKTEGKKEGKPCVIVNLLRLTSMSNVITPHVSIREQLIIDKGSKKNLYAAIPVRNAIKGLSM